jgi:hypothetical protein
MISANLQFDELSPLCKGGRGGFDFVSQNKSPFVKGGFPTALMQAADQQ